MDQYTMWVLRLHSALSSLCPAAEAAPFVLQTSPQSVCLLFHPITRQAKDTYFVLHLSTLFLLPE